VSALVKKELGLAEPVREEAGVKGKKSIGNLSIDQLVKVARMKRDGMLAKSLRAAAKQVAGTCVSLGCSIEGKTAKEFLRELDAGAFDAQLKD
jgi:large subunit ribosomal protein L11